MRKDVLAASATIFLIMFSISIANAASPIQNIKEIQGFPASIVAGSTYEVYYQFDNVAEETVSIFINLNVSNQNHPVNSDEFSMNMRINSDGLNCSEQYMGSFYCYNNSDEYQLLPESTNELHINFSSLPNLYPDKNYTFSLDILTEHPVPMIDVLLAEGWGQFNLPRNRIGGQSKIYMDEDKNFTKLWIRDRRTGEEFSRKYEVKNHYSTWYGEVYSCSNELGQTFRITIIFNGWVYARGTNVFFIGRMV